MATPYSNYLLTYWLGLGGRLLTGQGLSKVFAEAVQREAHHIVVVPPDALHQGASKPLDAIASSLVPGKAHTQSCRLK